MKKLFFLLLPLLAAAWLASLGGCGKCKGIEGKVLEFGTDKPIPDASVTLSDCEGELLGSFTCTDLAYATTNSDGGFDFGQDGFAVSAKATDYWDTGDDFVMVTNECPKPVLYLYPNAWLQVTVKNESGAYAFHAFGENFHLLKGEANTIQKIIARGNEEFRVNFWTESYFGDTTILQSSKSVKIVDESHGKPLQPNFDNINAFYFKVFLPGHQTTKISITY